MQHPTCKDELVPSNCYYRLRPFLFIALQITNMSDSGLVTCFNIIWDPEIPVY